MIKNGRIKQSPAYWCLNATGWNWNIDQVCGAARRLGEVIARTRQTVDRCAEFGVPNVIAFTGYKWLDAELATEPARYWGV